jgi:hypothetical protein
MSLTNNVYKVTTCPLCKSNRVINKFNNYSNRYSEDISSFLGVPEKLILQKLYNVQCSVCDLIYKKFWFRENFLKILYSKIVPSHPKGWETISKKFTKKYFSRTIHNFISDKQNKYEREIYGFLDSIDVKNKISKSQIESFRYFVKNYEVKKIIKKKNIIQKMITAPREFSRFNNFNSKSLFEYILKQNPSIKTFSEIGCPLWGMFSMAKRKKLKLIYFKPSKFEFWGKNCQLKGVNCLKKCQSKFKPLIKDDISFSVDYIGVYLYIDHVKNLSLFAKKIFTYANSIGIIIEDLQKFTDKKKLAVQHFSSFTKHTIMYLAEKYNFDYQEDFKQIKELGNNFYFMKRSKNYEKF